MFLQLPNKSRLLVDPETEEIQTDYFELSEYNDCYTVSFVGELVITLKPENVWFIT